MPNRARCSTRCAWAEEDGLLLAFESVKLARRGRGLRRAAPGQPGPRRAPPARRLAARRLAFATGARAAAAAERGADAVLQPPRQRRAQARACPDQRLLDQRHGSVERPGPPAPRVAEALRQPPCAATWQAGAQPPAALDQTRSPRAARGLRTRRAGGSRCAASAARPAGRTTARAVRDRWAGSPVFSSAAAASTWHNSLKQLARKIINCEVPPAPPGARAGRRPPARAPVRRRGVGHRRELDDSLAQLQPPERMLGTGAARNSLADAMAAGQRVASSPTTTATAPPPARPSCAGLKLLGAPLAGARHYLVPDRGFADGWPDALDCRAGQARGADLLVTVDNGIAVSTASPTHARARPGC